ncbi:MAG: amino acid--tRNA ligase-related protein, partial [Bdellovibrionales bacterium]
SPEIHLKKALTGGWTDIFEIRPCFRNGERSPHHESEFFMLEWYRAFADLSWIEQDVRDLIAVLGTEGWIQGGVPRLETTDWETLFAELFGFSLRPDSSTEELSRLCGSTGIHYAQDDTFNDLFHRLVIERIEPELKSRGPTLVYRFPPSLAALAKLDEQGWADRMELYWRGLEIANAFNEVNEAEEQQRRWLEEMAERERLGTLFVPDDQDLIQRMRRSMPPAGGIALGLERLYMACAELTHIQDLKPFTTGDLFTSR